MFQYIRHMDNRKSEKKVKYQANNLKKHQNLNNQHDNQIYKYLNEIHFQALK